MDNWSAAKLSVVHKPRIKRAHLGGCRHRSEHSGTCSDLSRKRGVSKREMIRQQCYCVQRSDFPLPLLSRVCLISSYMLPQTIPKFLVRCVNIYQFVKPQTFTYLSK